tara:strand:+ start:40 stop:435 length:396 start_codon:yes stop_codon:yes gene_type:complete
MPSDWIKLVTQVKNKLPAGRPLGDAMVIASNIKKLRVKNPKMDFDAAFEKAKTMKAPKRKKKSKKRKMKKSRAARGSEDSEGVDMKKTRKNKKRKKRKLSKWQLHIKAVKAKNPNIPREKLFQVAAKTYKK